MTPLPFNKDVSMAFCVGSVFRELTAVPLYPYWGSMAEKSFPPSRLPTARIEDGVTCGGVLPALAFSLWAAKATPPLWARSAVWTGSVLKL